MPDRGAFDNDLVRRRVTGFQKVMTHDLRVKIKGVLGERYPAEVQGCDAKTLDHIGARKVASYLKLGITVLKPSALRCRIFRIASAERNRP